MAGAAIAAAFDQRLSTKVYSPVGILITGKIGLKSVGEFSEGLIAVARILVIEDDPEQRFLITEMLDFCNHETVAISDGAAALDLLRRDDDFAAVFSDIQLPRLDGEYLATTIKAEYPHMPLVIVSVYANLDWLKQGVQEGAFFHLQKPYSIDQLQAVLDAVIHSHQGG